MSGDRLYLRGGQVLDGRGGSVSHGAVLVDGERVAALTSQAAELCGLPDRGVLAPDRRADIVAVEGDPLEDVARLRAVRLVVQAGQPRTTLGVRESAVKQEVFA